MELLLRVIAITIGLSIINVWVLRFGKATAWRGGDATTLREEFAVYGLPGWFLLVVGAVKLTLAVALIAGVWFAPLTRPAAAGMAVLMLGAVAMHLKVRDPLLKSLPAFSLLVLAVIVALL